MSNLPTGVTDADLEGTPYRDFQERLEYLDNNNGEKDQYMKLILDILYDNGVSKQETDIIQNAIYSYESAK